MSDQAAERWHWYSGGRVPFLVYGIDRYDHQRWLVQDEIAEHLNTLESQGAAAAALAEALRAKCTGCYTGIGFTNSAYPYHVDGYGPCRLTEADRAALEDYEKAGKKP